MFAFPPPPSPSVASPLPPSRRLLPPSQHPHLSPLGHVSLPHLLPLPSSPSVTSPLPPSQELASPPLQARIPYVFPSPSTPVSLCYSAPISLRRLAPASLHSLLRTHLASPVSSRPPRVGLPRELTSATCSPSPSDPVSLRHSALPFPFIAAPLPLPRALLKPWIRL